MDGALLNAKTAAEAAAIAPRRTEMVRFMQRPPSGPRNDRRFPQRAPRRPLTDVCDAPHDRQSGSGSDRGERPTRDFLTFALLAVVTRVDYNRICVRYRR